MRYRKFAFALWFPVGMVAAFVLAPAAHAQLSITLDQPDQVGAPGATLTYSGTVKNTSGGVIITSTSYDITNQIGSSFSPANITDVFGPAHQTSPKDFVGFGSTHEDIFTVTIPTSAAAGDKASGHYYVNYDITTALLTVPFSVSVGPAANTPEPGACALLLGLGMSGASVLAHRKRACKAVAHRDCADDRPN